MTDFRPPGPCPVCSEHVPARAKACPQCGASHDSGWNAEAALDALDLPDEEEFDYERFLEEEFGARKRRPVRYWFWSSIAAGLLLVLLWMWLGGGCRGGR